VIVVCEVESSILRSKTFL